ncbi:hypothetical protein FXO37_17999 [Capsicum annuum]|nr:hypothetical protein FXO37_17999 [Capsicum annuum]
MKKVLQNGKRFHFKVTKNKSITASRLVSLIRGNRLTNQQKMKCALVWFVHSMLLEKNPSKKVWIYAAFPYLRRYTDKSLDTPFPIPCLLRWHTSKCDSIMEGKLFKYKENNSKIVHPYLTPTVHEMEQRYIKTFKPYTDEVKDMSIDALKVKLKGMTVLTSLTEVADEDKDLGCNNYVPSPARVFDHAGSSEFKTTPDTSNDDDLRKRVAMLEKSVLDISSFVRDERLRRIKKIKKKNQDDGKLIYFLLFQFNFLS